MSLAVEEIRIGVKGHTGAGLCSERYIAGQRCDAGIHRQCVSPTLNNRNLACDLELVAMQGRSSRNDKALIHSSGLGMESIESPPSRMDVRSLLPATLEQAGYEVRECPSGKEALRLFRESPTDLVIMDILMPEKDGLQCIRELHEEFPSAKIVAITGGGAKVGTLNFLDIAATLGARRTLQKPFTLQELLQTVEDELKR